MQRTTITLAYIFILVTTGFVNGFAQQYPFVHYTPRDGLISNNIRSIYQDSKGRLYFTSINGLSVYDGARFTNHNSKNGLESDIVNCVMEMGDDSLWVVTNDGKIRCLMNGKMKPVFLKEPPPLIDNLIRDETGTFYAASERGLFRLQETRFVKLPFTDTKGMNAGSYIANIHPFGNYLLITRDNSLVAEEEKYRLYLYDIRTEEIVAETQNEIVYEIAKAPDGRAWASTNTGLFSLDTIQLQKGKIVFQDLPKPYNAIKKGKVAFMSFDREGNCWVSDKVFVLKKIAPDGTVISFSRSTGIGSLDISDVFQDNEGTTWISSFSTGVDKLVNSNFSIFNEVAGISVINSISYSANKNQLVFYSPNNAKAIFTEHNGLYRVFDVNEADKFQLLVVTDKSIFGFSEHAMYSLAISGNSIYIKRIISDSIGNSIGNWLVDNHKNVIVCGKNYLIVVFNDNTIYRKKIRSFSDHAAIDTAGNIWLATRDGEVSMYSPDPDNPSNYLEKNLIVAKKLSGILPRSIAINKNNTIWIGSRNDGIYVFNFKGNQLVQQFHLNKEKGLSDNFITRLVCDSNNNIWACSPSGLDKISIKNGKPVIENLTMQNNIYQKVSNVIIDKNNNAWALLHSSLVKITPENRSSSGYSPTLMISMIKAGQDTINNLNGSILSHSQNNLNFYFSATSFLDEKQVHYSYQLEGGSNNQWSAPSNNSSVSFIGLQPGDYVLNIKATFPAGRYPDEVIQFKFSIAPPWWQTVLFKLACATIILLSLIAGLRSYYRRKLAAQRRTLEKQQAIEKERTRIATDMHDDLGSGLSRIKFLSQALSLKQTHDENIRGTLEKITNYSDEMSEKMGEIVWSLNEKNDTLADLVAYTRSYTVEYLADNNIQCEAHTPMNLPASFITGETRRNVFLTVKECLHNIVKHAHASRVYFSVELNGAIEIVIHDNGKGIDWDKLRANSNGLQNIQKRMKEIKGKADFLNEKGTKVLLRFPLNL